MFYRRQIPKIARDILKSLVAIEAIEIDDGKISEAELDIAAVMVGYLDALENISFEASEMLKRRGLPMDRLFQTKQKLAEIKGIKLGEEGHGQLIAQILEALFASKNIEEVFAEDTVIRKVIGTSINKVLQVSEDIEREAKARLKNITEGTPEWDIEYPRMVAQIKRQKGL